MTKSELEALFNIAKEEISGLSDRANFEAHNIDSQDFFETSIWSLKAAMVAAYNLGKNSK